MEYKVKGIESVKSVPEWLKRKISQSYVQSAVWRDDNGMVILEIRVGGRRVCRLEAKEQPSTEEEWQRISDILELNHYMNWLKRFVESLSEIEDENTKEALDMSEKPRCESNETARERVMRVIGRIAMRCLTPPKRWWMKIFYYAIPFTAGYAANKLWFRIGL